MTALKTATAGFFSIFSREFRIDEFCGDLGCELRIEFPQGRHSNQEWETGKCEEITKIGSKNVSCTLQSFQAALIAGSSFCNHIRF